MSAGMVPCDWCCRLTPADQLQADPDVEGRLLCLRCYASEVEGTVEDLNEAFPPDTPAVEDYSALYGECATGG